MNDDPGTLWRNQESENANVGLDQVKARLTYFEAQVRRQRRLGVGIGVTGAALALWSWSRVPTPLLQAGDLLLAAGSLFIAARALRRRSAAPTGDAADCVAYLRGQLEQRRRITSGGWVWLIGPLLPGLAVLMLGLGQSAGTRTELLYPVMALLGLWVVVMLMLQRRSRQRRRARVRRARRPRRLEMLPR